MSIEQSGHDLLYTLLGHQSCFIFMKVNHVLCSMGNIHDENSSHEPQDSFIKIFQFMMRNGKMNDLGI
jgi:hypothetical protein